MSRKGHIPWNKGKINIYSSKTLKKMSNKRKKWCKENPDKVKLIGQHTKTEKWRKEQSKRVKDYFKTHIHPTFKGRSMTNGYISILKKDHPYSNKRGYVYEHRLVMEKHIGRYLKPNEQVHHINSNTQDNNIENLMLFPNNGSHLKYHAMVKRKSQFPPHP